MLKIKYAGKYQERLKQITKDAPDLTEEIENRSRWFRKNPSDTRLDDHKLRKKLKGKNSFSVTGDIRIVYRWKGKNVAEFLLIGDHPKVYGRI